MIVKRNGHVDSQCNIDKRVPKEYMQTFSFLVSHSDFLEVCEATTVDHLLVKRLEPLLNVGSKILASTTPREFIKLGFGFVIVTQSDRTWKTTVLIGARKQKKTRIEEVRSESNDNNAECLSSKLDQSSKE